MRLFISWSGNKSRKIAEVLRGWFPSVLQATRPYFSPDDIAKGARWSSEIAKELEASRIGLLVITTENQGAPWLLFEAGALAKNLDRSKVCPILFGDMDATDVKGPLVQFQAAKFSKDEIKRVVKMINSELSEACLNSDVLDDVFEMWWPKLEEQVNEALNVEDEDGGDARRTERDLLEEVLALTRRLSIDRERKLADLNHPAWDDFFNGISVLLKLLDPRPLDDEGLRAAKRALRGLEFITRRGARGSRMRGATRVVSSLRAILSLPIEDKELMGSELEDGQP
jgi:hypothetical protein